MNLRCENAIKAKNDADGSPSFDTQRDLCTRVLTEEYQKHLLELKTKIATLKKGSKQWWRLNRELLEKKSKCSSIPPLRDGTA